MRMTEADKVPEKTGENANGGPAVRRPFETLRREVDRIFDEFGGEFWRSPFRRSLAGDPTFRRELTAGNAPAVDIVEKDNAFEVTADVPGFDDKSIEVQVVNGSLWIKGERRWGRGESRETEGLVSERARVWIVPALLPAARWHRHRQDRGQPEARRLDGNPAE